MSERQIWQLLQWINALEYLYTIHRQIWNKQMCMCTYNFDKRLNKWMNVQVHLLHWALFSFSSSSSTLSQGTKISVIMLSRHMIVLLVLCVLPDFVYFWFRQCTISRLTFLLNYIIIWKTGYLSYKNYKFPIENGKVWRFFLLVKTCRNFKI